MLYREDLAYVQAAGFGGFAKSATPEIIAELKQASRAVERVVDVGCGSGESTRVLVEAGFETTAIEPSAALLDIARAVAPAAHFINASAYEADIPDCDAVLAVGEPLAYHDPGDTADSRVRAFFEKVRDALAPGGVLVFDLIVTGGPDLSNKGWAEGKDWTVLFEVIENRPERCLRREIVTFRREGDGYRRSRETHHARLFDAGAVRSWLEESGFTVRVREAYGAQRLLPARLAFFAVPR